MHKLVILVDSTVDPQALEQGWAEFLHQAEAMPNLRQEMSSRVNVHLFGSSSYQLMHELIFDTAQDLHQAMASESGRNAGRLLQSITGGKLVLFLADHKEDDLENIQKYESQNGAPKNSAQ